MEVKGPTTFDPLGSTLIDVIPGAERVHEEASDDQVKVEYPPDKILV